VLSVLHISTADNAGGSGRAAYRIHSGLRRLGHTSRMLVGVRTMADDPDVAPIWRSVPWHLADRIAQRVSDRLSLQYLLYPSSFRLLRHRWFREADVVQLYNLHGDYFAYPALVPMSRRKPLVWRLSDMWPMTGHCAYSYDCERWRTGCGDCPLLADEPALRTDRTALLWRVKRWVYARSRLTLVAPTRWIARLAAESPLLGRFPVEVIPNGLDTSVFRPQPRRVVREALGLDPDEVLIMFASLATEAPRKGGALLREALDRLGQGGPRALRLLVVGQGAERWVGSTKLPVTALPTITDDRMLAMVYAAADLFVLPTLAENLANSILEAMACGTPVVSFPVGGVPEAVRPGETGHLAEARTAEALAHGIALLAGDAALRDRLGRRGREVAEREYGVELQTRRFQALYERVRR
jgi:glycosyltransferase involved in cell wall biosynthesis